MWYYPPPDAVPTGEDHVLAADAVARACHPDPGPGAEWVSNLVGTAAAAIAGGSTSAALELAR